MKEASKFIYTHEGIQFNKSRWNWIWKTTCPQIIQIFIWKCTHNRLLTCSFIAHHQYGIGPECLWCLNLESTLHIIRDYPWAKEFWIALLGQQEISFFHKLLLEWLHKNLTNIPPSFFQMMPGKFLFAYGIWQLWLSRNNRIFNPSFETLN